MKSDVPLTHLSRQDTMFDLSASLRGSYCSPRPLVKVLATIASATQNVATLTVSKQGRQPNNIMNATDPLGSLIKCSARQTFPVSRSPILVVSLKTVTDVKGRPREISCAKDADLNHCKWQYWAICLALYGSDDRAGLLQELAASSSAVAAESCSIRRPSYQWGSPGART